MNSYSTSWWSLLLIYRPHEDARLSWPCRLTYSGQFTQINSYPSAAGPVQTSESSPVRDCTKWNSPVINGYCTVHYIAFYKGHPVVNYFTESKTLICAPLVQTALVSGVTQSLYPTRVCSLKASRCSRLFPWLGISAGRLTQVCVEWSFVMARDHPTLRGRCAVAIRHAVGSQSRTASVVVTGEFRHDESSAVRYTYRRQSRAAVIIIIISLLTPVVKGKVKGKRRFV